MPSQPSSRWWRVCGVNLLVQSPRLWISCGAWEFQLFPAGRPSIILGNLCGQPACSSFRPSFLGTRTLKLGTLLSPFFLVIGLFCSISDKRHLIFSVFHSPFLLCPPDLQRRSVLANHSDAGHPRSLLWLSTSNTAAKTHASRRGISGCKAPTNVSNEGLGTHRLVRKPVDDAVGAFSFRSLICFGKTNCLLCKTAVAGA